MASARKIIAVGLILGIGTLIVTYFKRQADLLYYSCFKLSGVKNLKFSLKEISMTLLLDYKNKSDISLTITKQYYEIYVNGILAAKIGSETKTFIGSHQTSTLPISVDVKPKELVNAGMKNLEQIILDKDSIVIRVKGKVDVHSGIISYKGIPIDESMTIGELITPDPNAEPC